MVGGVTLHHADDPAALELAVQSLTLAVRRHLDARKRTDLLDAFASAAETVWWICAIDEQLNGGSTRNNTDYARARNDDEMGRYIPALRWLRNRHTHQLPITTDEDRTPFFPPPGADYVLHVGSGFTWRATQEIRTDPDHDHGSDAYHKLVAGMKTSIALARACDWLERATGHEIEYH